MTLITMPRPRGFSPVGIYPRDLTIRIPREAAGHVRAAIWAWEVAQVRSEVSEVLGILRAALAAQEARSRSHEKRLQKAARAKSKSRPSTRKRPGIKTNSVQARLPVSGENGPIDPVVN